MLFEPIRIGALKLPNRIIMAPMTRNRADHDDNRPNALMAEYYRQRAGAGLIVSEGTPVSPQAPGYLWTPGIYTEGQVEGWRQVTAAVRQAGGRIFAQLWHCGRVSHQSLQPNNEAPLAPSAGQAATQLFALDDNGQPAMLTPSPARAMTEKEIEATIADFRQATENALAAGFDGVEIHGANGYLIDQFLNSTVNQREDRWGGSLENRARFALAVVEAAVEVAGPDRVGLRLSPHGTFNDMGEDPDADRVTLHLADAAKRLGIAYLHFVDPVFSGYAAGESLLKQARERFGGPVIACGEMDKVKAERYLEDGLADLIGFGRAYIANPDLPERVARDAPLNEPDPASFYGGDAGGYTDYPSLT
ncbi:alkene reductase [Thiohalomonas denitrificans]|uniref:alkene reductase n=1 Tax=Thiohalomonas denitrificans TaxID=415747 RepID=UPI0026EB1D74|nr:alkene reductase [Thiohalomonas denitrificans]